MNLLRPRWLNDGQAPDYRYSLANERTFLAWIRTALSLIAAAVAVVQLVPAFRISGAREVLGVVLAVCGVGAATLSYVRWAGNERAMRTGAALPFTRALFLLATTLMVVGVVVLLLALFGSR